MFEIIFTCIMGLIQVVFEGILRLIGWVILGAVRWERDRNRPVDSASGSSILCYGWLPLIGLVLGLMACVSALRWGLDPLGVWNSSNILILAFFGSLSLLCGYGIVELLVYRLTLDVQGLSRRTTLRPLCQLGWAEIREITYAPFMGSFEVRGVNGESIRVPRLAVGIRLFVAGCHQHLTPAIYEKASKRFDLDKRSA